MVAPSASCVRLIAFALPKLTLSCSLGKCLSHSFRLWAKSPFDTTDPASPPTLRRDEREGLVLWVVLWLVLWLVLTAAAAAGVMPPPCC